MTDPAINLTLVRLKKLCKSTVKSDSVRSPAGSGANTLVVGFAINGNSPKPILVRAIGPTLAAFGLPGAMPDPVLTIYRGAAPIDGNASPRKPSVRRKRVAR